jgi:hypothetical protein
MQDTETATASGPLGASVSWSFTLYQMCLTSGYYGASSTNNMPFTPTCWPLTSSNPAVNPANDQSITYLTQTLIPEFSSGLNALATGSMYNVVALAISIALSVIFACSALFIFNGGKCMKTFSGICLILFKALGCVWFIVALLSFTIWAGGLKRAEEDFSSPLGTNPNNTNWLQPTNGASATGFALAVAACAVSLVSCCCGCFTWSSEAAAKAQGKDPRFNSGMPQLPPQGVWGPGQGAPAGYYDQPPVVIAGAVAPAQRAAAV